MTVRACGKVRGASYFKAEGELALMSATNPASCRFPAAFCLGRPRPILPFLAVHAVVERKELFVVVALLLSLPSHASAAVLVGRG